MIRWTSIQSNVSFVRLTVPLCRDLKVYECRILVALILKYKQSRKRALMTEGYFVFYSSVQCASEISVSFLNSIQNA